MFLYAQKNIIKGLIVKVCGNDRGQRPDSPIHLMDYQKGTSYKKPKTLKKPNKIFPKKISQKLI